MDSAPRFFLATVQVLTAMKEFTTAVDIRATPEAVWAILTDAPGYSDWNPEINRVDGRIALGEKIKAHAALMSHDRRLVKLINTPGPNRNHAASPANAMPGAAQASTTTSCGIGATIKCRPARPA
jgi:hypothetical protein